MKAKTLHYLRSKENNLHSEDGDEWQQCTVIKIGAIYLGNNWTYEHFVDALSCEQKDFILENLHELDSSIRILAKGKFGLCTINTCGSDLYDHLDYAFMRNRLHNV